MGGSFLVESTRGFCSSLPWGAEASPAPAAVGPERMESFFSGLLMFFTSLNFL